MHDDHVLTSDGYRLPLHRWIPRGEIKAVVLGLHGFNDYGNSFHYLQDELLQRGAIALYAYDQRGFGATERPGIWAGKETLVDDALTVVSLLGARYPGRPVVLMGESMGAAVVLVALAAAESPAVDGAVLISPAVWGPDAMPWYQRFSLWLAMRLMPGRFFSSDTVRDLGRHPTDDTEVMRALSQDPLVLKGARVDALHGVSELMREASRVVDFSVPTQALYGLNDQIIPSEPVCNWFQRLTESPPANLRIALYPDGYHMLTRYSDRATVIADIVAWLADPTGTLPSGRDIDLDSAVKEVCAEG